MSSLNAVSRDKKLASVRQPLLRHSKWKLLYLHVATIWLIPEIYRDKCCHFSGHYCGLSPEDLLVSFQPFHISSIVTREILNALPRRLRVSEVKWLEAMSINTYFIYLAVCRKLHPKPQFMLTSRNLPVPGITNEWEKNPTQLGYSLTQTDQAAHVFIITFFLFRFVLSLFFF